MISFKYTQFTELFDVLWVEMVFFLNAFKKKTVGNKKKKSNVLVCPVEIYVLGIIYVEIVYFQALFIWCSFLSSSMLL